MEPEDEGQTADLGEFQVVEDEETPFSDAEPAASADNAAAPQERTALNGHSSRPKTDSAAISTADLSGQTRASKRDTQSAGSSSSGKSVKQPEPIPPASPQIRPETGRMVQLPETAMAAASQSGIWVALPRKRTELKPWNGLPMIIEGKMTPCARARRFCFRQPWLRKRGPALSIRTRSNLQFPMWLTFWESSGCQKAMPSAWSALFAATGAGR